MYLGNTVEMSVYVWFISPRTRKCSSSIDITLTPQHLTNSTLKGIYFSLFVFFFFFVCRWVWFQWDALVSSSYYCSTDTIRDQQKWTLSHYMIVSLCSSAPPPLGTIPQHLQPVKRGDSSTLSPSVPLSLSSSSFPITKLWQPWFGEGLS